MRQTACTPRQESCTDYRKGYPFTGRWRRSASAVKGQAHFSAFMPSLGERPKLAEK